MKRVFAAFLTASLAIGCAPPSPSGVPGGSAESQGALSQDLFPIPDLPTTTISDADRPKTIDDFVAQFLRRYKSSMYEPFIELAYWGSSTDAQKTEYLAGVKSTFVGLSQREVATITDASDIEIIEIGNYDAGYYPKEGDESIQLQPQPTHVLGITGHFGESVSVTNYFAVGLHEGKYYLCTIKHE